MICCQPAHLEAVSMATTPSEPQLTRRHLGRMLLVLCIGLVGLVILVLALLPYVVPLEQVQRALVSRVEAALQRRVAIGAVRLQILTGLGVTLEDVIIANPPGWSPSHVLRIGTLSVKIAFLPLLQRTIAITKMVVRDGDLVVTRDPTGQMNLADLAASHPGLAKVPAPHPPQAPPADATQPGGHPRARWLVSDVAVEGGTVTFVDGMAVPGEVVTTTVSDVWGHLRDISRTTPTAFDMGATLLTDGTRNIRVRGRIGLIPENLAVEGATIEAEVQAADLLLAPLSPYLGSSLPLVRGRVGADVKVQGRVGGNLRITGALSLADAAMRDPTSRDAATTLPKLMSTQDITLDLAHASIQLAEVRLDLFSLQATLTGVVSDVRTSPRFDLQLTTSAFAPGDLLTQIPMLASMIPAPVDLTGSAQLRATVVGTPRHLRSDVALEVNHLALKSGIWDGATPNGRGLLVETDATHVTLTTQLEAPRPPQIHLDFRARRLVFDQPRAKARAPAEPPPAGPTSRVSQANTRLPWVTLHGTLKIAEGHIHHLSFQRMTANVALVQGLLTTTQQATLYGGSYQGAVQINLAQEEPSYTVDARVAGVQLGEASRDLTSAKTVLQGVLTTRVKLSGQALTWRTLSQTVRGDGHATITDLQVTPAEAMPELTRKVTIVGPLGKMIRHVLLKRDPFDTVKATFHMSQGHIFSDHLHLVRKEVEILAKGYVGLDQSIRYNGTLVLSGERAKAQGTLAKFLRDAHGRIVLPFTVKGMVSDPQIVVEAKDLLGRAKDVLTGTPK
jgi:AsmA-like C-terminal region/Domain of Unknown Function (DUF748)